MNEHIDTQLTNLFITLSDMTRLRLLRAMSCGEVSVGYLADTLGESQPKISRHLAMMREYGVVQHRRDGKHIYYSIAGTGVSSISDILSAVTGLRPANGSTDPSRDDTSTDTYVHSHIYDDELPVHLL